MIFLKLRSCGGTRAIAFIETNYLVCSVTSSDKHCPLPILLLTMKVTKFCRHYGGIRGTDSHNTDDTCLC